MASKGMVVINDGPELLCEEQIARFTLVIEKELAIQITSLDGESGCGEGQLFMGVILDATPELTGRIASGYYNAETKKGWVEFCLD